MRRDCYGKEEEEEGDSFLRGSCRSNFIAQKALAPQFLAEGIVVKKRRKVNKLLRVGSSNVADSINLPHLKNCFIVCANDEEI